MSFEKVSNFERKFKKCSFQKNAFKVKMIHFIDMNK